MTNPDRHEALLENALSIVDDYAKRLGFEPLVRIAGTSDGSTYHRYVDRGRCKMLQRLSRSHAVPEWVASQSGHQACTTCYRSARPQLRPRPWPTLADVAFDDLFFDLDTWLDRQSDDPDERLGDTG